MLFFVSFRLLEISANSSRNFMSLSFPSLQYSSSKSVTYSSLFPVSRFCLISSSNASFIAETLLLAARNSSSFFLYTLYPAFTFASSLAYLELSASKSFFTFSASLSAVLTAATSVKCSFIARLFSILFLSVSIRVAFDFSLSRSSSTVFILSAVTLPRFPAPISSLNFADSSLSLSISFLSAISFSLSASSGLYILFSTSVLLSTDSIRLLHSSSLFAVCSDDMFKSEKTELI